MAYETCGIPKIFIRIRHWCTYCLYAGNCPLTWNSWRWISIDAMLCAFKNVITDRTSQVGGSWKKSLHLQPLQWCYCENSGSPASACVMRRRYSITYKQSFHAIYGLLAAGRVGNLLCVRLTSQYCCGRSAPGLMCKRKQGDLGKYTLLIIHNNSKNKSYFTKNNTKPIS